MNFGWTIGLQRSERCKGDAARRKISSALSRAVLFAAIDMIATTHFRHFRKFYMHDDRRAMDEQIQIDINGYTCRFRVSLCYMKLEVVRNVAHTNIASAK